METLVSYIGWAIVAASGAAYVWVFFRYVLFPKGSVATVRPHSTNSRYSDRQKHPA